MTPTATPTTSPGAAILTTLTEVDRNAEQSAYDTYRAAFTRRPFLAARLAQVSA
jgi:hypothetical protein